MDSDQKLTPNELLFRQNVLDQINVQNIDTLKSMHSLSDEITKLVHGIELKMITDSEVSGMFDTSMLEHEREFHRKNTPKSINVSGIKRDPVIKINDWKDVLKIIIYILALLGIGVGAGNKINDNYQQDNVVKITNDSTDKTVEKGD